MALVPAECPECGGIVKVDNKERLAICQYCGKPFVVKEAIQTFNNYYNNIYHITNNTSHNYGDGAVVNVYEDTHKDFVIEGGVLREYHGESLTPVVPEGVIAIEGGVFANSAITKVTLPSTLKELRSNDKEEAPFSGCKYLEEINLPEGLNLICSSAFCWCENLNSIKIPDSVEWIGGKAFYHCTGLTSITIPNNVSFIGGHAFGACTSLKKVYWNAKSVDICYEYTPIFSAAGTSGSGFELVFSDNVEKIPAYCCSNYSNDSPNIKLVTIGNKVTSIGKCAFYRNKSITSILIPDSVTSIGDSAFACCDNLVSVTIGNGVKRIGEYAFSYCKNLKNLNISFDLLKKYQNCFSVESFREFTRKKGVCQYCGGKFKEGLFSVKCSECYRTKDY